MKTAKTLILATAATLVLAPFALGGEYKEVQGRTGLPYVMEGQEKVWMDRGVVRIEAVGNDLVVTQEFRLKYPGPPLEKDPQEIKVAIREDCFRSKAIGPEMTRDDAKGFTSFGVTIDGRRVETIAEPWYINDKKDTATRRHTWLATFQPGQTRDMRIVSRAPLGDIGNQKLVQFVSKDVSHWRGAPDYLEIRFSAPGTAEARVAGLEPRPNNVNPRAVQWVYRKASPNRDVYIQLPPNYSRPNTSG